MTVLKVPDMHCEKCVERITNALSAAKLNFKVSLGDKSVSIEGSDKDVDIAIEEMDDLGFEAKRQ